LNGMAARACMWLLSGASDSSSKNDLCRPACSEQTNENLTIAQSVRISTAFEMALRLPIPLIASQMWDVQRRRRGSAPAMPWPAGYVPLTARICSHLKYWGLSAGEDAPAEDGKLWVSAWTE
jgi:hypothetical protein